jgi:putative ABC transport system substrate-binding protein
MRAQRIKMGRREVSKFFAIGALLTPNVTRAQSSMKKVRVGAVSLPRSSSPHWQAFEQRMAELGYHDGENILFEFVEGFGGVDNFKPLYQELVARNVDMLVVVGTEAALKAALEVVSNSMPVVIGAIDFDPVARGYVPALARPAGNITGVYFQQIELTTKRLQIFRDAFPQMRAATVFWTSPSAQQWKVAEEFGASLGLPLVGMELGGKRPDYDKALSEAPPEYRQYLFVVSSGVFFNDRLALAEFALRNRTASMFAGREWVDAGGLISYGPDLASMFRRIAEYVDRIARGAIPSALPLEQPTKFELVVNLKTAKALGVEVRQSIFARANDVLE